MEAELEAKASIEALAVDKAEDSLTAKNDGKKKASDEEKKEEKLDEEVSCPVCRRQYTRRGGRKPMVCLYDHVACEECWSGQRHAGERIFCRECRTMVRVVDCDLIDTMSVKDTGRYRVRKEHDHVVFEDGFGHVVQRYIFVNPLIDLAVIWLRLLAHYLLVPAILLLMVALIRGWHLIDIATFVVDWAQWIESQPIERWVPGFILSLKGVLPLVMIPVLSMATVKAWIGGLSLVLKGSDRGLQHNVMLLGIAVSSARAYAGGVWSAAAHAATMVVWLGVWKFQVEADMVAVPGAGRRSLRAVPEIKSLLEGTGAMFNPDYALDWMTGLWVSVSGFVEPALRLRVAVLSLFAIVLWHETIGPWVHSFSNVTDPAHSNSAAFRTVYRFGAGLWLTLLVWQGAVMPIRSWVTSGFSIMAVVLVVWGMTERRWIQLWRNKRKDMQRDKVTEGWKRDDNYFRIDNMPHHMAGDIDLVLDDLLAVIAFALLFAPHLPFPSSALFMLYSIIMAFAAYNLMGPFLSWLSTKPDWFEKKPKWAKYMPDFIWSVLSKIIFFVTYPLQMFWHTRHLNLDVFLIRLFSASVAAGMCFVATALTLMDEDKQYRILSAELVVGAAHLFFKDWVARHQGTSFVVSLYSYSLVVGLALDQTRFHRFMLSMGFAALCWFGLAVARADLLVHEVVAVNRVLLALAFVGPFLTTRALGVAVAVAISAVFVVLLQRGMGNEDAEAAENAALIAKDMVDDVMSRLPIGIQAFRELEQFELDRIYRESEEEMAMFYERNPQWLHPARSMGRRVGAARGPRSVFSRFTRSRGPVMEQWEAEDDFDVASIPESATRPGLLARMARGRAPGSAFAPDDPAERSERGEGSQGQRRSSLGRPPPRARASLTGSEEGGTETDSMASIAEGTR